MNKYLKVLLLLSPLLLIIFLIFSINTSLGNGFINILDSAIFLTKMEVQKKFYTLWTENNLGSTNSLFTGINFFSHLYSVILLNFNLSIKQVELVIYFIAYTSIFYSSWYAFYLIQKRLFNNKTDILLPFIAAFFYSFNIFDISLIGIIDQLILLQILYPFLLYILIVLLDSDIHLKHILASSIIMAITITVPIFSFAVYLCLFPPFLLFKKRRLSLKHMLLFILIFIITCLLAAPLIYALVHGYRIVDPYSDMKPRLVGFIFPPLGIMGIFQLFFHWTATKLSTDFNLYFRSTYGLLSSYMIWILILSIITMYWQGIKNKKILLFLTLPLIVSIFLSKGAQKPFQELNAWVYSINPIFNIFRTPGSKFGIVVMLLLPVLVLYALNINKNKALFMAMIFTVCMQTWIFFSPVNFIGQETAWWNKPVVQISQDYIDLISFLNSSQKEGASLLYPGLYSGHYDLKNGVKFSFQDILGKYIERPIIYPETNLQFSLVRKNINKVLENFDPKLVGRLSIRFIVIREDFDARRLNEKATVTKALHVIESKDYIKRFSSKLFTIYEVSDKYFKDLITIRTPNREYAPDFKKVAPYHYVVRAKMGDLSGNQVIFRNNYHPDWVVLDLKQKRLGAKQILVDNFANGWLISPLEAKNPPNPNQDVELDIYYYPQKILFGLSVVSIITIICIGSFTAYLILKKK